MAARAARYGAGTATLALLLAGCVGPTFFGARSEPSRLASLRRGESTTANLLLALGEPNGRGLARLEVGAPKLEVWLYDFTGWRYGPAVQAEVQTLLVFVREGRYEGHLWFEGRFSLPPPGPAGAFVPMTHPASSSGGVGPAARPRAERLEASLELGRSTAEDVVRALGRPSGVGRSQLPIEAGPRPMWAYYFEGWSEIQASTIGSVGRTFVFVYFREGRCDGYLWFSTVAPTSGGD